MVATKFSFTILLAKLKSNNCLILINARNRILKMNNTPNTSLKTPPTVPGVPLLGSAFAFVSGNGVSVDFLQKAQKEYGDVAHFTAARKSFYLVSDPALVRQVMLERAQEFPKVEEMNDEPRGLARFLGHGILTAGYEEWKPQRKLIQPLMQPRHIAAYGDTMAKMGEKLINQWQEGEQRNIHADMTQATMWIIADTMFGIDVEQSKELETMGNVAQKIVIGDLSPLLPDALTGRDKKTAQINAALTALVQKFKAEAAAKGDTNRKDLLSILMSMRDENGQPMSEEFLRNNILTMFFAGHETTANTLTWAFYYLAQNPSVLKELQKEVDGALAGQRLPTVEDLPKLPYTLQVIKETMRIQPTVAMIPRGVRQDAALGEYQIEGGSIVLVSPYVQHHDPRHWQNPDVFDPERFSAQNEEKIEKFSYMPFGGGPRICIGSHFALMEAQVLLALIVSRYELALAPNAKVEPLRQVTTSPKFGLPMIVQRRK